MNQTSIFLVQSSWRQVSAIAPQAGALFYAKLFAVDPALRPLFKGPIEDQAAKLMQMIGVAVGKLDDLDALLPVLGNLGRRHAGYGVQDTHYETVGAALLQTLEQGLGAGFTPAVREAWTEVYGVLADVMSAAATELPASA